MNEARCLVIFQASQLGLGGKAGKTRLHAIVLGLNNTNVGKIAVPMLFMRTSVFHGY
jgi:hypothetical protein